MPKLSIIVPVYKVEKYINDCVGSILNQTFTDFELILVDDGSPDNCGKICDEYAKRDSRVVVLHKSNGGLSSARNAGMDVARGEYIAFVDSDDFVASDMFEKMIGQAISTNADMVKCGYTAVDDHHNKKAVECFSKKQIFNSDGMGLLDLYFGGVLFTVAWNAVYKRQLADKVKFPEGLINEDNYSAGVYLFWAKKVVCMNETFYFYRDNEMGLSKVARNRKLLDKAVVLCLLHEYLMDNGVNNDRFLLRLEKKFARRIYHCVKYQNAK